jgi:hypothetical protein
MPHWPHGPRGVLARAVSHAVHVDELQCSALRLSGSSWLASHIRSLRRQELQLPCALKNYLTVIPCGVFLQIRRMPKPRDNA